MACIPATKSAIGRTHRWLRTATICGFVSLTLSSSPQMVLTHKQITIAESLGRKTDIPLSLGSLVRCETCAGFQAFITMPEQRVAYAVADLNSDAHGSGVRDPLESELHMNRIRVTGLPFPNVGAGQQNSRDVILCNNTLQKCIRPAHEVLDVNQVIAEFEMPAVLQLSGPTQTFVVRIKNDAGSFEPDIRVALSILKKKRRY